MADLAVVAYKGPGEQEAAEALSQDLPDAWTLIAGCQLPTRERDDVDLLIIGSNRIFVIEIKHWGPVVEIAGDHWRVNGQRRISPVDRNSQVARRVSALLRRSIGGFNAAADEARLVVPRLLLSHPEASFTVSGRTEDNSTVLLLRDAATALRAADAATTALSQIRDEVAGFLYPGKPRPQPDPALDDDAGDQTEQALDESTAERRPNVDDSAGGTLVVYIVENSEAVVLVEARDPDTGEELMLTVPREFVLDELEVGAPALLDLGAGLDGSRGPTLTVMPPLAVSDDEVNAAFDWADSILATVDDSDTSLG
ncbi:nuclease-related domain-containing protein [Nocardioides sp. zg-1230]|uniref:nuclease-related domain-containing protein n=1 Tax=Nocardioides sp. zg-1230 TaxID=2736601 RepID=UPI0015520F0D|nr:NERD domain-containing protein [Nocardioides sp. zg-1230]